MFDHITLGISDFARSTAFYDKVLATIGITRSYTVGDEAAGYGSGKTHFWIGTPVDGRPPQTPGCHFAFIAPDTAAVHAFHETALAHGARDAGEPGPRPNYGPDYYAAFVFDPDGHKIEAVHRKPL